MTVGLIWAQSPSGVIGRAGGIPWRLPEDQARFKELTLGHTVVMGRLTWESLPSKVRPLPGRKNVVVTRQAGYMAEGATVVGGLAAALTDDETWVIGGAEIYAQAMPLAQRLEITQIHMQPKGGSFFPAIDPAIWREAARGPHPAGPDDDAAYDFVSYLKVNALDS